MIIQESIISRGCDYYDTYLTLSWEEEWKLFCDSEARIEEESFRVSYNVCNVISRKDKINNKRKKHNKDGRIDTWQAQHRHGDRYVENREHQHLHTQKVFTDVEVFDDVYIDVDAGYWTVYDYELEEYVAENYWDFDADADSYGIWCGREDYNDWLEEVGLYNLRSDFDWVQELYETQLQSRKIDTALPYDPSKYSATFLTCEEALKRRKSRKSRNKLK